MAKIPNPYSELFREPNLLTPGKKPVGSVKIDWGHPLTKNLKSFMLCSQHQPEDLVDSSLSSAAVGSWGVEGGNQGWQTDESQTEYINWPGGGNWDLTGRTEWAMLWCGYFRATPSTLNVLLSNRVSSLSNGEWSFYVTSNRQVVLLYRQANANTTIQTAVNILPAGASFISAIVTQKNSGTWRIGANGSETDVSNTTNMPWTTFLDQAISVGASYSANGIGGVSYCAAMWHRNLLAEETESLYRDPYQFLIPS